MDTDRSLINDFHHVHQLEFLEANGLGGYASGTFSGAHSRRYHGVLVAALQPPLNRMVVVSKVQEVLKMHNEAYELSCNQFPGVLHPFGVQYLSSFGRDLFPSMVYEVKGVKIRKTIAAVHGENTTLLLYEVLEAPERFELELTAFYSCRRIHDLSKANSGIGMPYLFDKGGFQTMNYLNTPEFFIHVPKSTFKENPHWCHNVEYSEEEKRGFDFQEDLFTHGSFCVQARKGSKIGVIVSLEYPQGRDAFKLFREEKRRREALSKVYTATSMQQLALAADQCLVATNEAHAIVTGFPWFTESGRMSMISLTGLCLVSRRFKEARKILQKYAALTNEGLIPNCFSEEGGLPNYNSIDGSLWFFYSVYKYYQYANDKLFIKSLLPTLRSIVDAYYAGTHHSIKVDSSDELLSGGEGNVPLTWMDAQVGDWVVTPRRGKAVEVNALWYNALKTLEYFMEELNYHGDAEFFATKAMRVYATFNEKFWNRSEDCLFDTIDDLRSDEAIRPNQVWAASLPFPVLSKERAALMLNVVQEHLLISKGLRTLSPLHPEYKPNYAGDVWSRDAAYHQGTSWSFLLGAYVDALYYVNGEQAREEAIQLWNALTENLHEHGVGSISEIYDAEHPYVAKGCIAYAPAIAELLRVAHEYNLIEPEEKTITSTYQIESVR